MCGIAGKVHASGRGRVEEGLLRSMCGALVHRGPDDVGYYTGEGAGLGQFKDFSIQFNSKCCGFYVEMM